QDLDKGCRHVVVLLTAHRRKDRIRLIRHWSLGVVACKWSWFLSPPAVGFNKGRVRAHVNHLLYPRVKWRVRQMRAECDDCGPPGVPQGGDKDSRQISFLGTAI